MDKKEMAVRVSELLKKNGIRKPIKTEPQNFTISGPGGKTAVFTVSPHSSTVKYTNGDVERIISACIDVALDAIRSGEAITFYGFGSLRPQHRKARIVNSFGLGEREIPAQYLPKFVPGDALRRAAVSYGLNVFDGVDRQDNDGSEYGGQDGEE